MPRFYRTGDFAFLVLFVALTTSFTLRGLAESDLQKQAWEAHWISCPEVPRREPGVFHFRRSFDLGAVPAQFFIHLTADNRYELFVNGKRVACGPARGDLNHWRYDTLDIAPHLRSGKNVVAAVVWNYAGQAPMAQMTFETGLLVQGEGSAAVVLNTDNKWKVRADNALEMIPWDERKVRGYFVVGPGERWHGDRYPWGWETPEYDDSDWKPALVLSPGCPRGIQDSRSRWMLVPRSIPLMEEKLERLRKVVRSTGIPKPAEAFLEGKAPLTIQANTQATLLFDQAYLTTAYPEVVIQGGRGAEITLVYSESLLTPEEPVWEKGQKQNRNETEGKVMIGYEDYFYPDGREHRLFRPLWWRCYRYLQLEVKTAADPVTIEDLRANFTAYPFEARARFESDDPTLTSIWDVGWRTARLCAHETYMDTPFYEQLQYFGDTRIQALISLHMTLDNRLIKNAIELGDESRIPDGITQSRYPSALPQLIPPFSLFWIGMMRDLWWYRGDTEFLKPFLPGVRQAVGWFESRLSTSGLLGHLEWWDFTDWTDPFNDGVPPQDALGQSSVLSLQFALGLLEAAELEEGFGALDRAQHYRTLAAKIAGKVRQSCWDPSRRFIADTPEKKSYSQHANLLAVLVDAIPAQEQRDLIDRVLSDPQLTQCSYYFRYYLFRAMKKAGLADRYLEQLKPWQEMLSKGLTTWAEEPEIGHSSRSDCHAWSAHPNVDLLATVAGIEPAKPGFNEVAIRPHLGVLKELRATMPHPWGEISVHYEREGNKLKAEVFLPEKLSGWFYWQGGRRSLHAGRQTLSF